MNLANHILRFIAIHALFLSREPRSGRRLALRGLIEDELNAGSGLDDAHLSNSHATFQTPSAEQQR